MAGEWRSSTIGELCDAGAADLQTGPFGSQLHAHDYIADGIPVVPTEAIHARWVDHTVLPRISHSKAQELARHRLKKGDILFARRGVQATGHTALVRAAEEGFVCGTGAIRLRLTGADSQVDPEFLSHVLANPASVHWFKFHAIGATMPNLNEGIIRSFPLEMPPWPEQRAIARILSTLDEKIVLNRRMSETLEATARSLFRSWFVDFDPARSSREMRNPRLPRHIADLFPAGLIGSELDEIPEGWEVGTFGDHVEVLRDQDNPLDCPDTGFRHFSLPAFDNDRWPKEELGDSIKSLKFRVPPGAVLLSKLNPEIERVWLVDVQPNDRAVCSTEFLVLRARPPAGRAFVYCFARSPVFRREIEGLVTGTSKSHQRAQVGSVLGLAAVRPPSALVEAFEKAVDPLLQRTLNCLRESHTLAALRDTLLPQLVSGKLRVQDTKPFLSELG
jgi:type I restriction enzyme, S subunit